MWETKKNRENTRQRKQLHAQDNIYVVRQFACVHEVAGISLLSRKNTEYKNCDYNLFSLIKNTACQPKPPLHGLSLSKSPIKNHAILFGSSQVVEPNQTKLGSTKAQQISHLETSSITNTKPLSSKKQSPIPATHPPVVKLEDQLKLRTASTSQ